MASAGSLCEPAQAALLDGTEPEWVKAHLAGCEECRFIQELSREIGPGRPFPRVSEPSSLGHALDTLLLLAQESGQSLLSRYGLQERLGSGGQGIVYRALNTDTGETVALKVVRASGRPLEVVHAHLVRHPNVCRVYHTELHGDLRLIEMEFVEGESLSLRHHSLSDADKLRIFRSVCVAVHAAHEAGVLHLDLKPSNVLVRATGEAVVTDFGLSVRLAGDREAIPLGGTPRFMAPEQRADRAVDRRTDVYALGLLLEELFPRPSRSMARVIRRATEEDPGRRYADMASLLDDLDRPVRLRRTVLRASMALVPVAVMGVGLFLVRPAKAPRGDVLVLGGKGPDGRYATSAEVFDTGNWRWRTVEPVPDPGRSNPRTCHMRAVRSGDDVLVLGGGAATGCADDSATTNRVRVYSPASGSWSVAECQAPCVEHEGATFWLDRAERNPRRRWKKGECRPEGPCMLYGRNTFVALPLSNDDVLVYGGFAGAGNGPNELDQTLSQTRAWPIPMARTAEIYRRSTRTWAPLPPSLLPRPGNASAVNVGGGVLVCGGLAGSTGQLDTCELFDRNRASGAWRPAGRMPVAESPRMVSLGDVVLGVQAGHAWLWRRKDWWGDPAQWRWDGSFFEPLALPIRGQHAGALTRLRDGRVLLVGGMESGRVVPTAQVFTLGPDGKGGTWREVAPMSQARRDHAAVTLEDGRILVAGGCGPEPLSSAEAYDPIGDRWIDAGHMTTARCSPEAVALW